MTSYQRKHHCNQTVDKNKTSSPNDQVSHSLSLNEHEEERDFEFDALNPSQ